MKKDIQKKSKSEAELTYQNSVIVSDRNDIDWESTDAYYEPLFKYKSLEEFRIDPKEKPLSISDILRRYKRGEIKIDPEFQRNPVWSDGQQSSFIESVLLDIPLPSLFFNMSKEGIMITIDGLQRIVSLIKFDNGELKLRDLKVLSFLNGQTKKELPSKYINYIHDKTIQCHIIRSETPPLLIYDFFARLNTKGTNLNRMEVRNCLHYGEGSTFLADIAKHNSFVEACSHGISDKRMKSREAILRYYAFKKIGIDQYSDSDGIDHFLNIALQELNTYPQSKLEKEKKLFIELLDLSLEVFGEYNFRSLTADGHRGRINFCLFETVLFFLSEHSSSDIKKVKSALLKNYKSLLSNNVEFLESIQRRSYQKDNVEKRFEIINKVLGKCL